MQLRLLRIVVALFSYHRKIIIKLGRTNHLLREGFRVNALPDYILIEFFNWIKVSESARLNIGFVRECVMRDKHTYSAMDDLLPYAKEFIIQKKLDIEAWELIESMRAYLIYRYGNPKAIKRVEKSLWEESLIPNKSNSKINISGDGTTLIHMLTAVPTPLHTTIDFLEWLLNQEITADDVSKMPDYVFEQLAKDFLSENNGTMNNESLTYILHELTDKGPRNFLEKVKRFIALNTFGRETEKYKTIAELFGRYSNPAIMKCFFLPLAQDKMFEKFISDSWSDLNSLSKNYLDIFYSVKELSASGYDIKDKIQSLDVAEDILPCLVLWVDSLETAKCVELRDLEYKEVFRLLQFIVQNIKVGDSFEVVCSKAVIMADSLRREHKNITIIEQKFEISNSEIRHSQLGTFKSKLISEEELEK